MSEARYSDITPEIMSLADLCIQNGPVDPELYVKYDVKRGLRDVSGKGVLTGLTEISEIVSSKVDEKGESVPCQGKLYYRGYDIERIVKGSIQKGYSCYEEVVYLLLFGQLPNEEQLKSLKDMLAHYRTLPTNFVRDIIMKAPSRDMMNTLARSVLTLYSYDDRGDDIDIPNVLRQSLQLIALFPMLSVYAYQAFSHYHDGKSLVIHTPRADLSTAENILHLLRADSKYTELEARILDVALVLHAEHGGGNNSTFTTHVVTSSATDTYSSTAASLASLKGPRHGGANIKVVQMFEDMKNNVADLSNENQVADYLNAILDKQAFDCSGLIYGMGHAVYSLSDPRADVLKVFLEDLSEEKGLTDEFKLYNTVERLAAELIGKKRRIYKGVSANIDFYSGLVYSMLNLPLELYTPIFAISRISGWSAHRLEELLNSGKIIRPAYKSVLPIRDYVSMGERENK